VDEFHCNAGVGAVMYSIIINILHIVGYCWILLNIV
jgi:hypothetical protein